MVLAFANGKWTWSREADGDCPRGGRSHVKITAEYPLPQPPQDPIAVLTGRGSRQEAGSACTGADFDDKFVRTGD
jgi:serine/threonine-protein kinase